jgi:hypothetical protein
MFKRFIFILILMFFLSSFLVSAGQISLKHDFTISNEELIVTITNVGTTSSYEVYLSINNSNEIIKSESITILRPSENYTFNFLINHENNNGNNDEKLLLIKTYYSDSNGYSFSVPNVIFHSNNQIISSNNLISPNTIELKYSKRFSFFTNKNSSDFLVFSSDDLNLKNNLIQSSVDGKLNINLGKGSSLKGSIYQIYFISLDDSEYYVVNVKIGELSKQLIIFLLLIFFLINLLVIYYFFNFNKIMFDIVIFLIIFIFLFLYFKPDLILSSTITAGGDTASHYPAAEYYIKNLFPNFKISGWFMGNYAGFPLLQFYFPLPFFLMALLSFFVSIQVSFKIITLLGIFLLPLAVYFMSKYFKLEYPAPILAAISTLAFLFMEANSMWGANIPSTLAGEFSYSIAFALSFIFLGTLYKGINENKYLILNSLLIFIIGLTHLYGLLFCAVSSLFFILKRKNFDYLVKLVLISFSLLGVWLFPMFFNLKYTTAYGDFWNVKFSQIFPLIIIPFISLILLNLFRLKTFFKDIKLNYLFFSVISTLLLYFSAVYIGLVNIRFIPFIQLLLIIIGVFSLSHFITKILKFHTKSFYFVVIFVFLFLGLTIFHVEKNVDYIDHWIDWNYNGFENKNSWNLFKDINNYLANENSSSRVVFEHSSSHNSFGTVRAFEMLPFFANRSNTEGLYMQSSISAPFVFYIQALVSREKSCPFPTYGCARTNLTKAEKRLKMFNVGSLIVVSTFSKDQMNKNDFYNENKNFGTYSIYNIKEKGYVYVPEFRPILAKSNDFQKDSYLWFINDTLIDVHLVFDENILEDDNLIKDYFYKDELNKNCNISSNLFNEKIIFTTDCLNQPHIISVSYYPKWKSKNKEKIYYVSPSFMLIYPKENVVEINYKKTWDDYLGLLFTLFGILLIIYFKKHNFNLILNRKIYFMFIFLFILLLIILSIYIYSSLNAENKTVMEVAIATGSYTACDYTGKYKNECLLNVALNNNDANICTRIKNSDDCFFDYAKIKKEVSYCNFIKSDLVKNLCMNSV